MDSKMAKCDYRRPKVANIGPIALTGLLLLLSVCAAADEATEYHSISGTLRNFRGGVSHGMVVARDIDGTSTWSTSAGQSDGTYVITGIPQGTYVRVYLDDAASYYQVQSIPMYYERAVNTNISGLDFRVIPGVVVDAINADVTIVSCRGIDVYCGSQRVGTIDSGRCSTIFYPDEFDLPYQGELYLARPFYRFHPQDDLMRLLSYNCADRYIERAHLTPVYGVQTPYERTDVSASYSWEDPGGLGWESFPATPDNRIANNPDVFVRARFWTTGTLAKDKIRLVGPGAPNGVFPEVDLSDDNQHVATFRYPIVGCNRRNLRVQVLYEYGTRDQWTNLPAWANSGTSNGDLVVSEPPGETAINTADIAAFAAQFGKCFGDDGYNPCADYEPSDCIDLSDLPLFLTIYYAGGAKDAADESLGARIDLQQAATGAIEIAVLSDVSWAALVARLVVPQSGGDFVFVPVVELADRAFVVADPDGEPGHYILCVLAPGESGTTPVGSLVFAKSDLARECFVADIDAAPAFDAGDVNDNRASLQMRASLAEGAPNPLNPSTRIAFSLPSAERVSVMIFDVAGRMVRRLLGDELRVAGTHIVEWDGRDDSGRPLAAGMYVCALNTQSERLTTRLTILR